MPSMIILNLSVCAMVKDYPSYIGLLISSAMFHYFALLLALYFASGVVSHEQDDPLAAPEYVQDTPEELEKKWAQDVNSAPRSYSSR
jgi:hypothetical protein